MSSGMPKAVVFNCHYNGLSIIQNLGVYGINCVAMDCKRSIGTYSKYAKYVKCPNPKENEKAFIDFLYNYCKKEKNKPVLFPTNDEWVTALSRYKKKMEKVSYPCVADYDSVKSVIQKDIFYRLGKNNHYMTPFTWSANEIGTITDNQFPIAIKPKYRRHSSRETRKVFFNNMKRLRFVVLKSRREFENFIDKEKNNLDYLVFQEYISGLADSMFTVGGYADCNYSIKGLITAQKIRSYPVETGDCRYGIIHSVPDYIIENSKRVLKELKLKGLFQFEYKKDNKTGSFKLIEVNPRSWSWIGLAPGCGVNLPLIAYKDILGLPLEHTYPKYNNGNVVYVQLASDFQNCIIRYKKDYPEFKKSLTEWLCEVTDKNKKYVYTELNANDYPVFGVAFFRFMFSTLRLLAKG